MFGIFKSEAPRYRGPAQPNGRNEGILGALTRVVGGARPAYRGAGQPAAASSGMFGLFSGSPVYRTATPPEPATEPESEPTPEPVPEPELEAHCEPAGNGNGEGEGIELDHGEPLLARVPVTIVIRRSPE